MQKSQIKVGNQYEFQAGRNKTKVKIISFSPEKQSWQCETTISIKDVARFISEFGQRAVASRSASPSNGPLHAVTLVDASAAPSRGPKPLGDMSAMSAAHRVLVEENRPMPIREIMNEALGRGYCKLNGSTIFNTFNGGVRKEITKKGKNSRFKKVCKGLFAAK